jgi:AcrR family transcriptional regulator
MPYRHTDRVIRRLAARREAILAAACDALAQQGIAAVQIIPVAERAGIAAGTVYRYFPSKADLLAAVVTTICEQEIAAIDHAAAQAPGPLSALAAAITTFAARAIWRRKLVLALTAAPIEPELEAVTMSFRQALAGAFEKLIREALATRHLEEQDAALGAAALIGTVIEALLGPFAPVCHDRAEMRAKVQALTLFGLRALGVSDARARGLVVQTAMPQEFRVEQKHHSWRDQ